MSKLICGGPDPRRFEEAAKRGEELAREFAKTLARLAESERSAEAWESYAVNGLPEAAP